MPVTQSTEVAEGAVAAQLPRFNSARANNSANFGSFPAESRGSRLSSQPIAARGAGNPSPWQVQPDICRLGSPSRLIKPRQGLARFLAPLALLEERSSATAPNLLSMTPAASSPREPFGFSFGFPWGSIRAAISALAVSE